MGDKAKLKVRLCRAPGKAGRRAAATAPQPPSAAAGLLHGVSVCHLCRVSAPGHKTLFLARMATTRALLEPCGDGYLPGHAVLKDNSDTIPFFL